MADFDPDAYLAEKRRQIGEVPQSGDLSGFDPDAYLAQKGRSPAASVPAYVGIPLSFAQGATFGFSDEMLSATHAATQKAAQSLGISEGSDDFDKLYTQNLVKIREKQKQFEKEHKGLAIASEIAGAVAPSLATFGAAAPAEAATLGQIALRGAGAGAVQGGLYGAGKAEEGQRMEGAAKGGGIGLVGGAIVPPALVGAARVSSGMARGVRNMFISPETRAVDIIQTAAARSGLNPDIVADKMSKLGPEAVLADADENLLQQAVAAVNQFGPTKEAARQLMRGRNLGEHQDTLSVLSKQLGGFSGDDLFNALKEEAVSRQSKASPLYRAAFEKELPQSKDLSIIMADKDVQNAMKQAEFFAGKDRSRIYTVDGNPASRVLNDVERLHYAKQALFDSENAARRAGRKEEAKAFAGLRREITDQLDAIPEYKVARELWSSSMEAENAAQVGQDIFKMSPAEFKEAVKGMNDHELEMAKMGVMNAATEKAGGVKDSRSIAGMLTDKENDRQKIRALFGSEENYQAVIDNAVKWDTFKHTAQAITSGSPTAERISAQSELAGIADAIDKPLDTLKKEVASAFYGSQMSPDVAKHIGEIMMKKGLTRNQIIDIIGRDNAKYIPLKRGATSLSITTPVPALSATINRDN